MSQAFVERVFSLCGFLTAGRRNRANKSLEIREFFKLWTCMDCDSVLMQQLVMIIMIQTVNKEKHTL